MKKWFICVVVAFCCFLSIAAYADDTEATPAPTMDVIPSLTEEEDYNVDDPVNTPEPDSISSDTSDTETTSAGDNSDSSISSATAVPESTSTAAATTASVADDEAPLLEADVEEPEPTPASYEEQTLTVLGNIQAYLLFFVVVVLLYFCYKFLRIFF